MDDVKRLIETYVERVWNGADEETLRALTTADFEYRLGGQPARDRAGMLEFLRGVHAAFPDWRVKIEALVADETSAAIRWVGEVTHEGDFHGIAPTGKRVRVSGINFYRIADGTIAAEWEETDSLGLLQQLGAFGPG